MKHRLVVIGVLLFVAVLSVASRRSPLIAQGSCSVTTGDGTPPLEIAINENPSHCGFLQFAWRAFFAMNWPAMPVEPANTSKQARGVPDPSKKIGQTDGETVWEQYQPNWYLFSPNNPPPAAVNGDSFAAWNQNAQLPAACGPNRLSPGARILSSLSKFDAMPGVIQASGQPLIDQNGYYARYEIRLGYQTFNYININQFYRKAAQTPPTTFNFPTQSGNAPGAIFIKAAWKVLSQAERDSHRFHTAQAWMFTPAAVGVSAQSTCVGPVVVGLVGLHIVQKTQGFPLQIWATFEQIDNSPADPANPGGQTKWSFFDPASARPPNKSPDCPNGSGPTCDWQPTSAHRTDKTGPTQVVRSNPIPASPNNGQKALDQVNESARQALLQANPSSAWQFYRLVEAQWQIAFAPNPPAFFPSNKVANVTMETYSQTNSCMACHMGARGTNLKPSDMSFELRLGWDPVVMPNLIQ